MTRASNYPYGVLAAQTLRCGHQPAGFPRPLSSNPGMSVEKFMIDDFVFFSQLIQHDQWPGRILNKPRSPSRSAESAWTSANADVLVAEISLLYWYKWMKSLTSLKIKCSWSSSHRTKKTSRPHNGQSRITVNSLPSRFWLKVVTLYLFLASLWIWGTAHGLSSLHGPGERPAGRPDTNTPVASVSSHTSN